MNQLSVIMLSHFGVLFAPHSHAYSNVPKAHRKYCVAFLLLYVFYYSING